MNIQLKPVVLQESRECGSCALCCKLLKVVALQKEKNTWCQFANRGSSRGCRVHDVKPDECNAFSCLWLLGMLPDWMKPDKAKLVVYVQTYSNTEKMRFIFHEDPSYAGAFDRDLRFMLLAEELTKQGNQVLIMSGDKRKLLTPHSWPSNPVPGK